MIGPRINAGGRVGKCSHGANLLMNSEPKKIFQIASELEQFNKERKILESNLLSAVLNLTLEKNKGLKLHLLMVLLLQVYSINFRMEVIFKFSMILQI